MNVAGACGIAAILLLVAICRSWPGVGIALTATAVIVRLPVMRPMPGKGTLLSLVSIGLLTWVLGRNRRRVRLAAFVSMAAVAAARASSMFPSFRSVLYRSAANDWLFYESQARTILATGSLEGGEPVFYFQPLYRYIKFLEHFVFGDGDALVTTFAVLALGVSTVWCASRAASRPADRHQMLWAGAAGAALLLTVNSPIATGMIRNGLSEYPAWTLLVLSCGLLASSRPTRLATANLLLAVTGLIRTNDIPGLFVVATAIATRWRRRWFAAISILFFIVPIVVIILGHNVHYGGQWALLSATSRERDNVVITPSDAVRAATDAGVRSRIVEQFRWMAFVDGSQRVARSWGPDQLLIHFPEARTGDAVPGAVLSLGMHALQALWLLAIFRVASRKELRTLRNFALLAAPAGLLAPFFVFRVTTYYPRNVMSGHLVMGLAAMWVGAAESEQRGQTSRTWLQSGKIARDGVRDEPRRQAAGGMTWPRNPRVPIAPKTSARPSRGRTCPVAVCSGRGIAAAGGASMLGGSAFAGQAAATRTETPSGSRQRFRAYVRFGTSASVRELRLLPISPRQVVVRSEAAQICYTTTAQGLGSSNVTEAFIPGHGGVGTVIEIGARVNRVAVGDRVVIAGTRQCGECYNCIRGRADHCLLTNGGVDPNSPVAEMPDGTKVTGFTPCCSELMVVFEESCVPVFTRISSVELAMLHDTGLCGLAATMTKVRVEAGSDVVVLGAGPIGLAAIQGARIQGAAQIIAVDPIRYRRDAAVALGATIALDPNVEGNGLVQKIQGLCRGKTDRRLAGGGNVGPDFVVEAVGGISSRRKPRLGPIQPAFCHCSRLGSCARR